VNKSFKSQITVLTNANHMCNHGDGVNVAIAVGFLSLFIQQLDNIHAYQLDTEHWANKSILREVQ